MEILEIDRKAGGLRRNSGRKRVRYNEKKLGVTVYIERYKIDDAGGMDSIKKIILDYFEKRKEVTDESQTEKEAAATDMD